MDGMNLVAKEMMVICHKAIQGFIFSKVQAHISIFGTAGFVNYGHVNCFGLEPLKFRK
jgi:hypothetical protein